MPSRIAKAIESAAFLGLLTATPALAASFTFDNGSPDGLIATLSRPAGGGHIQTETADDFTLKAATSLTSATFTGLLPTGTPLADRIDTKVCRNSPGTQSSPSPAFLVMMRNARITLFAERGVPVLEAKTKPCSCQSSRALSRSFSTLSGEALGL